MVVPITELEETQEEAVLYTVGLRRLMGHSSIIVEPEVYRRDYS